MAVTTDPFVAADLAAFIPEKWSPIVNEQFFASRVMASFCTDLSSYVADGGDTVHVPDLFTNNFSVQTQSTQGAEITTAGPAQVDTTMSIGTHKYVAFLAGKKEMKQMLGSYDYAGLYSAKAGRTLSDALESALTALWSSLSTNTVGTTSAVMSDLNIRQAINKLDSTNYPLYGGETSFFFHPTTFWTQVIAIQKYYDQSQRGINTGSGASATGGIQSGFPQQSATDNVKGNLYGIPVRVSSNIVSGLQVFRNLLLHKSCFGFALQTQGPYGGVDIMSDYLVQNIGLLTVADILYGVGVLREPGGVQINTNNTGTTS